MKFAIFAMKRLFALFLLIAPAFAQVNNPGVPVIGLPVIGGAASKVLGEDANQKLATYSLSGNTTTLGTVSGALTSGNCIKSDASGNLVDAATTCGGGGGSPGGSTTQVQVNTTGAFAGITNLTSDGTNVTKISIVPPANANTILSTGYSLTGSSALSMLDFAGTLNTTGSPDVWALRVTDTARGASTKLLNIYGGAAGASTAFSVDRFGTISAGDNTSGQPVEIMTGVRGSLHIGYSNGGGIYLAANVSLNGNWFTAAGSRNQASLPSTASYGWGSTSTQADADNDTDISRGAAATVQLGRANTASPVAYALRGQGSRSGTDTNIGGANVTMQSGNGTGTGTISSLILQSPVAVGSGTGAQTQTTGLTIKGGQAVLAGPYTVSTLPTGITGGMAYVTDAVACTFLATLAGGGSAFCPVVFNGSAWVGA